MKIHFYMFPENYEEIFPLNVQTKDMISLFAELFGEYPFIEEKYGHADFLGGGAMEHQTCSSFGFWNQWVVVHELAHQWWGDLITCNSFHHIWLNEGFATYSEALWYEYLNGPGTASYYQMTANLYLGPGTVYVEDPQNENTTNTIGNCISDYSGLLSMGFTDIQSLNAVFDTKFADEESILLFKETPSFSEERALGIWKKPATGGKYHLDGGQFVFISGRPYRYSNSELRSNSEFILENFFHESKTVGIDDMGQVTVPKTYALHQNYPNPFNPGTIISWQLADGNHVDLTIFNILGEKVSTPISER